MTRRLQDRVSVPAFRFDPAEAALAPGPLEARLDLRDRDLHVEVGFGKDIRSLREAEANPDALYLGVEISRKKARKFLEKVARLGLRNVFGMHADVRAVLAGMLPEGGVASFTILFPDPWPKRRHHKNRWIQPETAARLARALRPGGTVRVATDHAGYAAWIRECFAGAGLEPVDIRTGVPEEDRSLFARRFERLGHPVTHMLWRKAQVTGSRTAPGPVRPGTPRPPGSPGRGRRPG